MYYCSQAVHLPHTPPDEFNGEAVAGTTPTRHMDMIRELDLQMGLLVQTLKEEGIYENTVFIFTSDNGGLQRRLTLASGHSPNDIYRGGKNTCWEGGHRVPFIVNWPAGIGGGRISEEPVLGLDVMATLAAITGQEQAGTGRELIYTQPPWKLIIQVDKQDRTDMIRSPMALFNLEEKPEEDESRNLIHDPEQQERIQVMFDTYNQLRQSGQLTVER